MAESQAARTERELREAREQSQKVPSRGLPSDPDTDIEASEREMELEKDFESYERKESRRAEFRKARDEARAERQKREAKRKKFEEDIEAGAREVRERQSREESEKERYRKLDEMAESAIPEKERKGYKPDTTMRPISFKDAESAKHSVKEAINMGIRGGREAAKQYGYFEKGLADIKFRATTEKKEKLPSGYTSTYRGMGNISFAQGKGKKARGGIKLTGINFGRNPLGGTGGMFSGKGGMFSGNMKMPDFSMSSGLFGKRKKGR